MHALQSRAHARGAGGVRRLVWGCDRCSPSFPRPEVVACSRLVVKNQRQSARKAAAPRRVEPAWAAAGGRALWQVGRSSTPHGSDVGSFHRFLKFLGHCCILLLRASHAYKLTGAQKDRRMCRFISKHATHAGYRDATLKRPTHGLCIDPFGSCKCNFVERVRPSGLPRLRRLLPAGVVGTASGRRSASAVSWIARPAHVVIS